jgi:hypothetical protein
MALKFDPRWVKYWMPCEEAGDYQFAKGLGYRHPKSIGAFVGDLRAERGRIYAEQRWCLDQLGVPTNDSMTFREILKLSRATSAKMKRQ